MDDIFGVSFQELFTRFLIHFKVLKITGIKEKTGETERNCNKEVHLSVNIFLHNLGKIDQATNESYKSISVLLSGCFQTNIEDYVLFT